MKSCFAAAALAAALTFAAPAGAAVVTHTYDFSASDFVAAFEGTPPPFANVTGTVTVTFDDALNHSNVTAGITLNDFSASFSDQVSYSYNYLTDGIFVIGGLQWGAQGLDRDTDDFGLQIRNVKTAPVFGSFTITQAGYDDGWHARQGTVTLRNSAVPEPGAWAMLLAGFGTVGYALRRRRPLRPAQAV